MMDVASFLRAMPWFHPLPQRSENQSMKSCFHGHLSIAIPKHCNVLIPTRSTTESTAIPCQLYFNGSPEEQIILQVYHDELHYGLIGIIDHTKIDALSLKQYENTDRQQGTLDTFW
jgi:hypothetical protein